MAPTWTHLHLDQFSLEEPLRIQEITFRFLEQSFLGTDPYLEGDVSKAWWLPRQPLDKSWRSSKNLLGFLMVPSRTRLCASV